MKMATFKKEFPNLVETIITECVIIPPMAIGFTQAKPSGTLGADTTFISSNIVKKLQLKPLKQGFITGIGGDSNTNVYLVHIQVPTGDVVTDVEVMENDYEDYDVIIGTDVIMFGDFLITNADEKTIFQFRTPSKGDVSL